MSAKTKEEMKCTVRNCLQEFRTGQELFLHLHASGRFWGKESLIIQSIKEVSKVHYETISNKVIRKFPIRYISTSPKKKPVRTKKRKDPKPKMELYDLPDKRMVYIGKFKQ
jgi:hypothetical protein